MRPDLVLFDCDGVLVDSEPISISVLQQIAAEAGVHISETELYTRFLGKSMTTIGKLLQDDFGVVLTEIMLDDMRQRLYARFRADLQAIAGVREAIRAAGWSRYCVASSSQPERIRLSLSVAGLLDLFEPHIFSATMVKRGKPNPDLFLYAAKNMAVAPESCVVVEDSTAGIMAAKAAGMKVIAFAGGTHAGPAQLRKAAEAQLPDAVIDHMRELPDAVNSLA